MSFEGVDFGTSDVFIPSVEDKSLARAVSRGIEDDISNILRQKRCCVNCFFCHVFCISEDGDVHYVCRRGRRKPVYTFSWYICDKFVLMEETISEIKKENRLDRNEDIPWSAIFENPHILTDEEIAYLIKNTYKKYLNNKEENNNGK